MKLYQSKLSTVVLGLGFLTGCLASNSGSVDGQAGPTAFDVNLYPANSLVCDPLGGGGDSINFQAGLRAELYYLDTSEKNWYKVLKNVGEYYEEGIKSSQNYFFTDLFVPTRRFEMGFPLKTGGVVKDDSGNDLNEYFALKFNTVLRLGPDDPEGEYELALLTDDGSILSVREDDGVYRTYVDNDGDHPTRLGCGSKTLTMTRDSEHVIQIDYYQGPRYHIALVPLWRKIGEDGPLDEPLCGLTGNSTWFDFNNDGTPTHNYEALLSRGWKPIKPANYQVPKQAAFNPCTPGVKPEIFNKRVSFEDGAVVVRWETDIPATSQVRYVNMATGQEVLTHSDNILRVEHEVYVDTLSPGRTYLVQAVSISDTYGIGVSDPVTFTYGAQ